MVNNPKITVSEIVGILNKSESTILRTIATLGSAEELSKPRSGHVERSKMPIISALAASTKNA
jgi:DeoR/GlpR family transcriptional regulator of sugar metabolism